MEESGHQESTRIPSLVVGGRHVEKKQEAPVHSFFTRTRVEITEARKEKVANLRENPFQAKLNGPVQGIASNAKKRRDVTTIDIDVSPRKTPRLTVTTLGIVGVGSSTVASRKLNASVIDGTFVRKPAKWAKFQQKIHGLDELAEFPDRDVRLVRHSKCGRELRMKEPYNIANFETHVSTCKGPSKTAKLSAAGTPTLDSIFKNLGGSKKASPIQPQKFPCPGITARDDSRIPVYLLRSPSCGGGGPTADSIGAKMYPRVAFAKLSKSQKDAIRAAQRQQYQWRNEEDLQRVVSTSCRKESLLRLDNTTVPCTDCQSLLSIKSFKQALSMALPDSKNLKFTPKVWRNVKAAEKWGSFTGLKPLMEAYEKVRIL